MVLFKNDKEVDERYEKDYFTFNAMLQDKLKADRREDLKSICQ